MKIAEMEFFKRYLIPFEYSIIILLIANKEKIGWEIKYVYEKKEQNNYIYKK